MSETIETVAGVQIARPADPVALIDEDAFAQRDEFLPYWAELWPSARRLAEVVAAADLSGRRVIELGCGLGLPAIAAARAGAADVLAGDWAPEAIVATRANAQRNGVALRCAVLDWREPHAVADRGPFDLVLAADVLYERRHVAPLTALLTLLGAEVWLADPGRPAFAGFTAGLSGWACDPLAAGVWRMRPGAQASSSRVARSR